MNVRLSVFSGVLSGYSQRPPELLRHAPLAAEAFDGLRFDSITRISILGFIGALVIATLLLRRLLTGVAFFPPKDYRVYTIFNRKDFLNIYGKEELPSDAPIERLEGTRLRFAWVQCVCLFGLLVVDMIQLARRIVHGKEAIEEAVELGYWTILLALFVFRFYPTPYRPLLFLLVSFASIVPPIILVERDLWEKLLLNPHPDRIHQARYGWCVYVRLVLSLAVGVISLLTPRVWYPVDPYAEDEKASPEQTASTFSFMMSYSWIGSLVTKAIRKDIEVEDLPVLPDYDRARLWSHKILKNKRSSTFKTLLSLMRYDILFMMVFSLLIGSLQFIWVVSMRELLAYIEMSSIPTVTPWVYVVGLFTGPLVYGLAWEAYVFNSTRLIIRVKAALTQSLLRKTLKIRFSSESGGDEQKELSDKLEGIKNSKETKEPTRSKVGMINNLMSTDLEQLTDARDFFLLFGSVPTEIIFALIFLYGLLGWASLVGVALMLITMVVPAVLAKKLAGVQRRVREATDARIGLMTETLNSIRVIKFFGMEKAFLGRIRDKREKELWLSMLSMIYNLGFHTISTLLPIINMLFTFGIFTKIMKQPLTASVAFTSISLFDILRSQFIWVAFVTQQVLYAFVSFDRIDKFLIEGDELESTECHEDAPTQQGPYFKNATLSWNTPGSDSDDHFRLSDITVECVYGGLTVIAGPVGSGKSSFLMGLLEEMRLLDGEMYLPRKEGIAYVSQTPWLQNETIKDNILFGSSYNEERYQAVLEACGLATDMENFEAGDQTEVGERGVTLSGGQKARLSLARAVYSSAQTIFLDDVLSALDAGTSKLVFEKCIKGDILAGRTVILVTHHVSLVSSAAKKIIFLADGRVVSDCAPQALTERAIELMEESLGGAEAQDKLAQEIALAQPAKNDGIAKSPVNGKKPAKLIVEEERAMGRVDKRMIWGYVRNFGGLLMILGLVVFSMLDQLSGLANIFFVGLWADQYQRPGEINVNWWLFMYAAILVGTMILNSFTYGLWYTFQWLAARRLHEKAVKSVMYSPIRFFDTTPLGRIINRLSQDIKSIDGRLGSYLHVVCAQVLDIVFRLIIMSSLIPSFLVPTIFVSLIGFTCGELYVRAQVGVKRIMSVKESPLFSHFGDTISGIVTIRAFSCQGRFLDENIKRIDAYSQPAEALFNLNRWIGIRIGVCTAIIGASAGVIALSTKNYSPGLIGFSLSNALAFSSSILSAVRYFNGLEVELNSYERISEYINLKPETPATTDKEPPAAWPTQGDVKVSNLSVKYSEDGPEVLHNVSFEIKPRERVGVVGRTGAGKSSLALSLLGFTEVSNGSITINGLDIKNVNLETLRQRVTIIPQDPVLFSGTIRSNLDPFDETDDSELQAALDESGLAETGDSTSASINGSGTATPTTPTTPTRTKKIKLNTTITAGGENLSQGQRQLLAFARALVRRSKLVILDEATSSTDMKTDERIQKTLRTSFPDSSLITIAHRLRTVMLFDRIVVLDNLGKGGEVVEFDTPFNLLSRPEGVLYNLARKSGEFDELLELATQGMQENQERNQGL